MSEITPLTPENAPNPQSLAAPAAGAPTFDPHLFPARHRPLRQLLMDHNPCLLLSTVCMLLGCFLINGALRDEDQTIKRFALLAVMNLYEVCIIPLGLVLIRRTRGAARDGWWLILFELLFLVNATFINVDFGRGGWKWSFLFNAILLVVACGKAAILFRGLKIGLGPRTFGFFALMLAIVYGMPIFFALVQVDGVVSPRIMYGLWWLVGLLPVIYDQIARMDRKPPSWDLVQNVIRRIYLIAPWLLLTAHLGFSHWAHHSEFYLADLAPVVLGLSLASTRVHMDSATRTASRVFACVAIFFSVQAPAALQWFIQLPGEHVTHTITPLVIAAPAVMLTIAYSISMVHLLVTALAISLAAVGFVFRELLSAAARRCIQFIVDHLPATMFAWGAWAILAAFILLAIGAAVSLRRIAPQARPPA